MDDRFSININQEQINSFTRRYTSDFEDKVINLTNLYNMKIARDAKNIITNENRVDTGYLRNSIKIKKARKIRNIIRSEIYSGTKYGRFVHEGAEHNGNNIVPHFVPFNKAPSLLSWAKRHRIIYKKMGGTSRKRGLKGKIRNLKSKLLGDWYFKSRDGKEHKINISKGGLLVKMEPTKFFEKPVEKYKDEYADKLRRLLND